MTRSNRLTAVTYPSGSPASVSYSYDPMGNRLTMVQDGVTTNYTYDAAITLPARAADRIWPSPGNNDGQMLTKGSQSFSWDSLGA